MLRAESPLNWRSFEKVPKIPAKVPELTEGGKKKNAGVWGLEPMVFSELSPQILGLIIVRRLLDLIFSQHDLAWIDNILPEKEKKEADKKKRRKGAHEDSDEEVGRMGGLS